MGLGKGARMTVGLRFQYVFVKARQKARSSENSGSIGYLHPFEFRAGHSIPNWMTGTERSGYPCAPAFRGEKVPLSGQYLPRRSDFPLPRTSGTPVSALLLVGQVREFTPELGPARALGREGPNWPNLILEGLQMAKKKLKKGKKLHGTKTLFGGGGHQHMNVT
jgi:hypothetical protein